MDLTVFKDQFVKGELGITEEYGRIFTFIDFSNVNKWFEHDTQDWNNKLLSQDERLVIDIEKLKPF